MIQQGLPWATVWGDELPWVGEIPHDWAYAFNVVFAEAQGVKFNWKTHKFYKQK